MRKIIVLSIAGSMLALAGTSALVLGVSQNKEETLGTQTSVTQNPTSAPTFTPSPTLTPTPTIVYRYIPTATPTVSSSPTSAPQQQTQTSEQVKSDINGYEECKRSCPRGATTRECTTNEDGKGETCKMSSGSVDQGCIDSCKSKYGLTY